MYQFIKLIFACNVLLVLPVTTEAFSSENRIALVIGNSRYENAPHLKNTSKDADAVAVALRETGFKSVTIASDLTLAGMIGALRQFSSDVEHADWAVIYYAGHGLEINGTNFLIPIDAKIASDRDISFEAVNLSQILTAAEGAKKLRIVLLDACRENPFLFKMRRLVSSRGLSRGLARIEPDGGTIVVYAAKDGQVAWDGGNQNSPFAAAFLKHVRTPGLEINRLFRKIRGDVIADTDKRQEPFVYGSLPDEDFYFLPSKNGTEPERVEHPKSDAAKFEAETLRKEQTETLKINQNQINNKSVQISSQKLRHKRINIDEVSGPSGPKGRSHIRTLKRHKVKMAVAGVNRFSSRTNLDRAQRPAKSDIEPQRVVSQPKGKCRMFNGTCL